MRRPENFVEVPVTVKEPIEEKPLMMDRSLQVSERKSPSKAVASQTSIVEVIRLPPEGDVDFERSIHEGKLTMAELEFLATPAKRAAAEESL